MAVRVSIVVSQLDLIFLTPAVNVSQFDANQQYSVNDALLRRFCPL